MRISIRTQKWLLMSATGGCLAAAVTVIAIQLRPPSVGVAAPSKIEQSGALPDTIVHVGADPSREDFARFWEQPLRRALYDPPPAQPEVKQPPPLRVELLGTILEAANSLAMVRAEQGSVEYKRVGDSVGPSDGPAQIVEIRGDAVILQRAEERITLQVQTKELR